MNNEPTKDDEDDVMGHLPVTPSVQEPVAEKEEEEDVDDVMDSPVSEDVDVSPVDTSEEEDVVTASDDTGEYDDEQMGVLYDQTKIDLRGETRETLRKLINQDLDQIGATQLDDRVREVGSWENIIFRAIAEESAEDTRVQEAIAQLAAEDREGMKSVYRDPETGKVLLRSARITKRGGEKGVKTQVSAEEALLAFEDLKSTKGGGYRIPLYNSGLSVDILVPTGNDIQTMITNCLLMDQEMGASQGAHYFAYYDLLYKTQILNFIKPLIVNTSYLDWRKQGRLWSTIKLPDLTALVANIGAMCYKDGFENFVTRCTREVTPEHPELCQNVETFTANIFDMIVTRFAVLSKSAIEFMTESRGHAVRHSLTQIAKYQSELGFEGERIKVGDITFIMRIPTVAEYQDAGNQFIADIRNEIQGDNTDGHYAQFGFRYMRTFLPWVASIEGEGAGGEIFVTSDKRVILRAFEKLDSDDDNNVLRDKLREYVNRVQLTYVGRPSLPCAKCGHVADTPSGMVTLDPFSAFFTQALQYSTPSE